MIAEKEMDMRMRLVSMVFLIRPCCVDANGYLRAAGTCARR
jgi:hypothetical protein